MGQGGTAEPHTPIEGYAYLNESLEDFRQKGGHCCAWLVFSS